MKLLIDDERTYGADIVARTYKAGLAVLRTKEITHLYLDHDLGGNKTGYDLLKEALNYALLPNKITLVTANPVGLINMKAFLIDCGYKSSEHNNTFTVVKE